jgi:NAD+ diphosphatase
MPTTRTLEISGDGVRSADGRVEVLTGPAANDAVFLGLDQDHVAWFARPADAGCSIKGLREIVQEDAIDPQLLAILAQARSMVGWHATHRFCAACGQASAMADGGYRRHCPSCGANHFPRTDPVVIMAVIHDDAILLGRQAAWRPGMYSALAGFMEPGETIEQAVAREVREEAGIQVADVRYIACQPWPFPSSLMIGTVARAQSSVLTVDSSELEDARWFGSTEVRQMVEGRHPQNLSAANPYAIAHHIILAALAIIEGKN